MISSGPERNRTRSNRVGHLRFPALLFALLVLFGLSLHGCSGRVPDTAPDISLPDLDGRTVSLSDFQGRLVMLNFWATWCPPCQAELPLFIELQENWGGKGLTIVGISMDQASRG